MFDRFKMHLYTFIEPTISDGEIFYKVIDSISSGYAGTVSRCIEIFKSRADAEAFIAQREK